MSEDESIMLNVDPLTSAERKFGQLPLEARHSICLEIAKQKRQSVASSIFIPKELSRKIRMRRMAQKKDKSALLNKNPIQIGTDGNINISAKSAKKRKPRKVKKSEQEQKIETKLLLSMKHPESFPVSRPPMSSERIHTILESLRDRDELEPICTEVEEPKEMQAQISNEEAVYQQASVVVEECTDQTTLSQTLDMPNLEQLAAGAHYNVPEMRTKAKNGETIEQGLAYVDMYANEEVEQSTIAMTAEEDGDEDIVCYGTIYLPGTHNDAAFMKSPEQQQDMQPQTQELEIANYSILQPPAYNFESVKELQAMQHYNMTQQSYRTLQRSTAKQYKTKCEATKQYYHTQSNRTPPLHNKYAPAPKLPLATTTLQYSTQPTALPSYTPISSNQSMDYEYASRPPPPYQTLAPPYSQYFSTYLAPMEHTLPPHQQNASQRRFTAHCNQQRQTALPPYSNSDLQRSRMHHSVTAASHPLCNASCAWSCATYVTAAPRACKNSARVTEPNLVASYHRLPPAVKPPPPQPPTPQQQMAAMERTHNYAPLSLPAPPNSSSPIDLSVRTQQMCCRSLPATSPAPHTHFNAQLHAYQAYRADPQFQINMGTYAPQPELTHFWQTLQHNNFGAQFVSQQRQQHQQARQRQLDASNAYSIAYAFDGQDEAPHIKQPWYY